MPRLDLRPRIAPDTSWPEAPATHGRVLQELRQLPAELTGDQDAERVQAALVLGARGAWQRFVRMRDLARQDWRDALVAADLADEDWRDRLTANLGP
jgi:hypothetical protein